VRPEHEQLGFMLMCPAWDGLYKARIAEKVREYYALLLEPSSKTRDAFPDDYLRGAIAALKWAIEWPDQEMNAAAILAQEEARDAAESGTQGQRLFGGSPPGAEVLNGNG
jgi:hypothetical protein